MFTNEQLQNLLDYQLQANAQPQAAPQAISPRFPSGSMAQVAANIFNPQPSAASPVNVDDIKPPAPAVGPVARPPILDVPPDLSDAEKVKKAAEGIGADVSTQQAKQTKAEKDAIAERLNIASQKEANEKVKGAEAVEKAAQELSLAHEEENAARAQAEEHARRAAEAQARYEKEQARFDADRANFEANGSIRDMFGGDMAKRFNASLFTSIGAFASARGSGMPNIAGNMVLQDMKEWHDREISRIEQSKELMNMSQQERDKALALADAELKNKEAAAAGLLAKQRATILASHGMQEAQIASDQQVLDYKDAAAKMLQDSQVGLRAVTTSSNHSQQEAKLSEAKELATERRAAGQQKPAQVEQGTLDQVNTLNSYLKQVDETLKLAKEHPELVDQVMKARRQWQRNQELRDVPWLGKGAGAVLGALGAIPKSEEEAIGGGAFFNTTHDLVSGNATNKLPEDKAEKAREIYRGIKSLEIGKATELAKRLGPQNVEYSQQIASTLYGKPEEQIKALEKFREDLASRRDEISKNKPGVQLTSYAPVTPEGAQPSNKAAEFRANMKRLGELEAAGKKGDLEWSKLRAQLANDAQSLSGQPMF